MAERYGSDRFCFFFLKLVVGFFLLVCTCGALSAQQRSAVLISIDGLAAYHLEDESLELPNIRTLIRRGAWAEYSETVFPSVTHPSHTTLITGVYPRKHGVVGNRVTDRRDGGRFHITNLPRKESIQVETLFDAAREKGLKTAAFFWPETREDPSIDFNVAEVFNEEGLADIGATDPVLLQELRDNGIPIDEYFQGYGDEHQRPAGDIILTRAAAHVFEEHRPGFLALHLLSTDVMQHNYGPRHYLSRNALTVADHCVGLMLEAVRRAGREDEVLFVITGDHGFVTVDYELNLAPIFDGLTDSIEFGGSGWNLFLNPKGDAVDPVALDQALERASRVDGVSVVLESAGFPEIGLPTFEENPYIPGRYLIIGEADTHLKVDPEGDRSLRRTKKEEAYHGHGCLPTEPALRVGLVVAGPSVRQGVRTGPLKNVDVAPTIAQWLGLSLPNLDGRVAWEIYE